MSEVSLLKALVLEDEWPTRNYLVELIEGTHLAEVVGGVATLDEAREALQVAAGLSVDVVFVDVPKAGRKVAKGEACAVVESVKAASDIYAPVSGEVTEANAALADSPGDVNAEPMGKGWFFKLKLSDKSELASLMDQAVYAAFVKSLG